MPFDKHKCFLCKGLGFITIGVNIFRNIKEGRKLCPHCNGRGVLTIRKYPNGLTDNRRK